MGTCCPYEESAPQTYSHLQQKNHHSLASDANLQKFDDHSQSSNDNAAIPSPTEGEIMLPDGSTYKGMLKNGVPHGHGVESHENGDVYEGPFLQGVKEGNGQYRYRNNTVYEGQFINGDISGQGKMKWGNGDWYEGSFKDNVIHGNGRYYCCKNDSYFQGSYQNGKRHGRGKIKSKGEEIQGYWDQGEFKFKKVVPFDPAS